MKLPMDLLHGVSTISVFEDPSLVSDPDECLLGRYSTYPQQQIQLAPNLAESQKWRTVLHELLHHIEAEHGLELPEHVIATYEANIVLSISQNTAFWRKLIDTYGNTHTETPKSPNQGHSQTFDNPPAG